jgi:hypothetical protein
VRIRREGRRDGKEVKKGGGGKKGEGERREGEREREMLIYIYNI